MNPIDAEKLREIICDDGLAGITYMLVWGELDEDSEGYRALSDVLFDDESADNPDGAPSRDLSDPEVRRRVFECVMQYPDVRAAVERVLRDIAAGDRKKPWSQFW
jgi:hypothetical protein